MTTRVIYEVFIRYDSNDGGLTGDGRHLVDDDYEGKLANRPLFVEKERPEKNVMSRRTLFIAGQSRLQEDRLS